MATYTITTTAEEDRALRWATASVNRERGTAFTVEQFVQHRAAQILVPLMAQFRESQSIDVKARYEEANATTQADVRALLGIVPA